MKTKYIITKATLASATVLLLGTACSSHKSTPAHQPAINQNWEAPTTLIGKTVVWDYTHAKCYYCSDGHWRLESRDNNIETEYYTAIRNTGVSPEGADIAGGRFLVKKGYGHTGYDYSKIGRTTGRVVTYASESDTIMILHFDTPTTGTATYTGSGEGDTWKGSGIRFIIK